MTEQAYYTGSRTRKQPASIFTAEDMARTAVVAATQCVNPDHAAFLAKRSRHVSATAQPAPNVAIVATVDGTEKKTPLTAEQKRDAVRTAKIENYELNGMFYEIPGDPWSMLLESLYTFAHGIARRYKLTLDPDTGKIRCNCQAGFSRRDCVHCPAFRNTQVPYLLRLNGRTECSPDDPDYAPDGEDEANHRNSYPSIDFSVMNPTEDF